jgi:hypothetical protein
MSPTQHRARSSGSCNRGSTPISGSILADRIIYSLINVRNRRIACRVTAAHECSVALVMFFRMPTEADFE